jgi:undecaprenyl-diphosphatase
MLNFIQMIDIEIIKLIDQYVTNDLVIIFFNVFTFLGYSAICWIVIFIFLYLKEKDKYLFLKFGLSFGISFIVSDLLFKSFFSRQRPFLVIPNMVLNTLIPKSNSFPSSHALFSGISVFLLCKYFQNKSIKSAVIILSILISLSRVILKVHFLTDVLCGYLLGICIGYLIDVVVNIRKRKVTTAST